MPSSRWTVSAWTMVVCALLLVFTTSAFAQAKPKGREVSGAVFDADQKPVAGATVTVGDGGPSATTAADGTFKLTGVTTANSVVEIKADGFTTRTIPLLGATTALSLQVGLVKPQAAPTAPPRTIAGVVSDGNHQPLAGATVTVRGTQISTTTAPDGTFALTGVATGALTLDVQAPNQPPQALDVAADRTAVSIVVGQAAEQAPPPPVQRKITGKILDPETNEEVAGAQILVPATGAVIFTEADGSYVIENAPPGAFAIQVSAGGRETRDMQVPADKDILNIGLAIVQGEQIVIEGRAPAILKSNLANGASVISDKDLNRVSSATVDSAMQGKLAGANLQFNSGAPGGGAQLRLRGISTINGQSSPLYVIDGVIVSNVAIPNGANAVTAAVAGGSASNQDNPVNRIADINPNDIENVEVLKGASAAALYGSKAANGVVIITTKRGRNGENHVEVTQRVGMAQVSKRLGSRHFDSVDEVIEAFGATSPLVQAFMDSNGKTYDHEAELERTAISRETLASASGGNDKGNYYGSVLVRDEPGVVIGTFYEKQTGRIAVGYKLWDRLQLGVTANVMHSKSDRGLTNNDNTNTSYYVTLSETPSFVDLRQMNGVYPVNPAIGQGTNSLQTVELFQNREDLWRVIGGANAALDAYKADDGTSVVKVLSNVGADSFNQKNNLLSPNELIFEPTDGLAGTSIDATTTNVNFNVGAGAVWAYQPKTKKFKSALSGGLTYESVDLNSVYVTAQNLTAGQPSVDSGSSINVNQNRLRTKESGVYAQEEVSLFEDRLSVLGGMLGERSSLNGNSDKYYAYPKVAAVYSLIPVNDNDDKARKFETFRVRAAYGEAGNRPNYGQKFTALNSTTTIDGNAGIVLGVNAGDPNIEPERQREVELGTDLATKDQRVVVELTGYQRSISNLLLQRALPTSTGFTNEFFNGGSMRNRGVEAALQVRPLGDRLDWTSRAIFTLNRSLITDLPDGIEKFDITAAGFGTGLGSFRIEEGKSATQIVARIDANGTVAAVGNGEPDFRVGWSNTVSVGRFTFGALLDWQHGSDIVNLTRLLYDANSNSADKEAAAERIAINKMKDARPYIEDASFVKIRELSAAYDLPKKVAEQLGPLKTMQLSFSARNVFTFTNYSGLDPEVSNFGGQPIGRNYDVAPYPPSRSFWLSITAGL